MPIAARFYLFASLLLAGVASLHGQVGDTASLTRLVDRAWTFHQAATWDSSIHYYQAAAVQYGRLGRQTEQIDMWCRAARDLYTLGAYDRGLAQVQQARQRLQAAPLQDSVSLVRIDRIQGLYFLNTGYLDSAHHHYAAARHLMDRLPSIPLALQADVLEELAIVEGHQGYRSREQARLREVLALRRRCCAETEDLAITHSNLGFSYWQAGDFARATDYFAQALRHLEAIGSPNDYLIATIYNNLAYGYGQQQRWTDQLAAYQAVLARYRRTLGEVHRDLAICYNNLGFTYGQLGDYTRQGQYYRRALAVRRQLLGPDHPDLAVSHQNLGFWYASNRQPQAAEASFREALRIRQVAFGPRHPEVARTYNSLATFWVDEGDAMAALTAVQAALIANTWHIDPMSAGPLPPAEEVIDAEQYIQSLQFRGQAWHLHWQQTGDTASLRQAGLSYRALDAFFQQLRRGFVAPDSRQIWSARLRPAYEEALGTLQAAYAATGATEWLALAVQMIDHSRGLLLRDALQAGIARLAAGLPPALRQQERALSDSLAAAEKAVFDYLHPPYDSTSAQLRRRQDRVFAQRQAYQALIDRLEADYPAYFHLKYADPSPSLAQLRRLLPNPSDALLNFFVGDEALFVFGLTATRESFHRVALDSSLHRTVAALRTHLTDQIAAERMGNDPARRADFVRLSHQLYAYLLAPVVADLGITFEAVPGAVPDLIIIPDGWLGYLPFEVLLPRLPVADEGHYARLPYLLRYRRLRYAYASHLALPNPPRARARRGYLGLAPHYEEASTFSPLQGHAPEVLAAQQLLGGQSWLGADATEGRFRAVAGRYRLLHLAMHTVHDPRDPRYAYLAFAPPVDSPAPAHDDGRLHTYEIAQLELRAELAVLSACGTGQGPWVRGEGIMSLARAFRAAGCASLVMSLWEADDEATRRLMEDFFRHGEAGMDKAAALRQARLDYLARQPHRHPAYWAAFVLIGDAQPWSLPPPRWPWWALGSCLLAGLSYWGWRAATTRSG